jgi:hypothetical protein
MIPDITYLQEKIADLSTPSEIISLYALLLLMANPSAFDMPNGYVEPIQNFDLNKKLRFVAPGGDDELCTRVLHFAAAHGLPEVIEVMSLLGADIDAPGKQKRTALFMAGFANKDAVVKKLITLGADIRRKDFVSGGTIFHIVTSPSMLVLVEGLLSKEEILDRINVADKYSHSTPLHEMAIDNKAEVLEKYLRLGANLEAKNDEGNTPLHEAGFEASKEAFEKLQNLGANKDALNRLSQKPGFRQRIP